MVATEEQFCPSMDQCPERRFGANRGGKQVELQRLHGGAVARAPPGRIAPVSEQQYQRTSGRPAKVRHESQVANEAVHRRRRAQTGRPSSLWGAVKVLLESPAGGRSAEEAPCARSCVYKCGSCGEGSVGITTNSQRRGRREAPRGRRRPIIGATGAAAWR